MCVLCGAQVKRLLAYIYDMKYKRLYIQFISDNEQDKPTNPNSRIV